MFMPPEALRAKPRYSDKLDTFSTGVLIIQIITRQFPTPTDAERVMEDPKYPTGEIIVPVPELERRENDISKVSSTHPLLPIVHHCIKDRDRDRPSADQLCQRLAELKAAPEYEKSKIKSQQEVALLPQTMATLEAREREVEELRCSKEREVELRRSKEREVEELRRSKVREVAELRQQLQALQVTSQSTTSSSHQKVRSQCKHNTVS